MILFSPSKSTRTVTWCWFIQSSSLSHPNQGYNSVTQTKAAILSPKPRLQLCHPNQAHNSVTQTKATTTQTKATTVTQTKATTLSPKPSPGAKRCHLVLRPFTQTPHTNGTRGKIGLRFNGNFTSSHRVRLCAPYKLIRHKKYCHY